MPVKIKLYNYLTRKVETLKPVKKDKIGIYACGPTVYDFVHIGNLRTFIFEDVLRRTLEYFGYKVKFVMNITDIDDKIINRANKEKISWKRLARKYEKYFLEDIASLNIKKASIYPRASEHIKEMLLLIERLEKKGIAYKTDDGIYFNISKYPKYGVLVKIKKSKRTKSRIIADSYNKEEVSDFALWKFRKPNEPFWPAKWGKGRPGWHIECSAMSIKHLGMPFDIHCGAIDLLFPHHENEIAQSEGAFNKKFANFFVEGEHLLVEGQKMSKSLNNFYTLRDLEKRGFHPLAFRLLTLSAHYQSKLNFTFKSLESAEKALFNLWENFSKIAINQEKGKTQRNYLNPLEKRFKKYLANNLDTPKALSLFQQVFSDKQISQKDKIRLILKWDKIFSLNFEKINQRLKRDTEKIKKLKQLAEKRERLRKEKKWLEADRIREKIKKEGCAIEDTKEGPKLKLRF